MQDCKNDIQSLYFFLQALDLIKFHSSRTSAGTYYHVGTVPNKQGKIFVADVRMMVAATPKGYKPLVVYGRRARKPLTADLSQETVTFLLSLTCCVTCISRLGICLERT